MTHLLIKLDKKIFSWVKFGILWYVKKNKHKKHKYNAIEKLFKFDLYAFITSIFLIKVTFVILGFEKFHIVDSFSSVIWAGIFILHFLVYKRSQKKVENYDEIYSHRKHPQMYKITKETFEILFEEFKPMRLKYLLVQIWIIFFLLLVGILFLFNFGSALFIFLYLIMNMLIHTVDFYAFYVFDFDPPDKKKKKEETDTLTDLARKQLQQALDKLKPKRVPIPIPSLI